MTEKTLPKAAPTDVWRDPYADTFVIESSELGPVIVNRHQMGAVFDRLLRRVKRANDDGLGRINVFDVDDAQLLVKLEPTLRPSFGQILGDPDAKKKAKEKEAARLAHEAALARDQQARIDRRERRTAREQYTYARDRVLDQSDALRMQTTASTYAARLTSSPTFYLEPNGQITPIPMPEPDDDPEDRDQERDDEDEG